MGSPYLCGSLPNAFMSTTGCGNYNGLRHKLWKFSDIATSQLPDIMHNINCKQLNGNFVKEQYSAVGSNQYIPCMKLCCNAGQMNTGNMWPLLSSYMVPGYNNNNDFYNPYMANINYPLAGSAVGPSTFDYNPYYVARILQALVSSPVTTSGRVRRGLPKSAFPRTLSATLKNNTYDLIDDK
ncbi:hypothetical protein KIN20_011413 [Parelaphostrongylus tenuis]|uniref:Uncharacterized protein n=1 Tax=Parelaphostrongylus tenuis TaxID=148309 RepID=A0AAD5MV01_PARTN|nr:hypothetical protein KIN20_011413 [Parelaphostrongylus tenuis]